MRQRRAIPSGRCPPTKWLVLSVTLVSLSLPIAPARAAIENELASTEGLKLVTAQMVGEFRSRASRLGTSAGASDTTWVGYTPGHAGPGNYWSIYGGAGKDGFNRPTNGVSHKGLWDWESMVQGDSLQGWWPLLNVYTSTGGQTRGDRNRPWWAVDFGNMANYRINEANGRTPTYGPSSARSFPTFLAAGTSPTSRARSWISCG